MKGTSGKLLADIYSAAWRMGIKTTYYLRTMAATQIEKSTVDASKYGFTQKREYGAPMAAHSASGGAPVGSAPANGANGSGSMEAPGLQSPSAEPKLCRIDDPDCEACQ
jgi:ribonucleoside-diphosphate reductase alpha chain